MKDKLLTLLKDKTSWTGVKYKNAFLAEADYFIDILKFETYLHLEEVYQNEDRIKLGEPLSITDKDLWQFLIDRGQDKLDLYQNRIDYIYNKTLETLRAIDDKCEEYRAWKQQTFNKETTEKELKDSIIFIAKCTIAYTRRRERINVRNLLASYLPTIPTETQVAYIRLQIPALANLKAEDFKDLAKVKPARKIYARVEGNLVEYPVAVLNKQGKGSFVEGNFVVLKDKEGQTLSKIGTPYGVLTAFDFNILVGMMSFMTEVNDKYILAFSDYALLKRLGLTTKGGRNYTILEDSKKKISSMTVSIARFIKGKRENITGLENYAVFSGSYMPTGETARKRTSENPLHFNYYLINPLIAESLALKYLAWIDIKTWNSLPTPTAKRLYEYITKKKGIKAYYEENLKRFCAKLPLEIKNITRTIEILKRDLETLKKENIIADYNIGDSKIGIHFSKGKTRPRLLTGKIEGRQAEVFKELIKAGVTQDIAISLIRDYNLDIIRRQLEWLPYRNITENKAGMLVKAIKDNWLIPAGADPAYRETERTGRATGRQRGYRSSKEIDRGYRRAKVRDYRLSPYGLYKPGKGQASKTTGKPGGDRG